MPFLTKLRVEALDAADQWRLIEPLAYYDSERGMELVVPAGFTTDLASIPARYRQYFSVNGKHRRAAVLHDYLYANRLGERAMADRLFLQAMADSGVSATERWLMYAAVRLGGWAYWYT